IRQTTTAARADLTHPRRMIAGKIRNCRVLLRRNGGDAVARTVAMLGELAAGAERAESAAEWLGTEGVAARLYFEAFPALVARARQVHSGDAVGMPRGGARKASRFRSSAGSLSRAVLPVAKTGLHCGDVRDFGECPLCGVCSRSRRPG